MEPQNSNKILPNWQQQTLEKLLFASLKEQRTRRRWSLFFKLSLLIIICLVFIQSYSDNSSYLLAARSEHTALIDVRGGIFDQERASADHIISGLRQAFNSKNVKGIILRINSPGGSPVQASYVFNEIRRLKAQHDIKVIAVCSDMCVSGAYYIAAACDEIYANPSSLLGSIGVTMSGFGFVDALHKLGIERRLLTAGQHKNLLDSFVPLRADEVQHMKQTLAEVHQHFISDVRLGRGKRLHVAKDIFSGLVWSGEAALKLGLIDGYGRAASVARDVLKHEDMVDYTDKPDYFEHIGKHISHYFVQSFDHMALATQASQHLSLS